MGKILMMIGIILHSAAYGQLQEGFSDGDFVNNPLWIGDSAKFTINNSKQLQTVYNNQNDTVVLATHSQKALNMIWEFDVKLDFDPSSSNQLRIYLISNNSNLKDVLNGYFLQIGEIGQADSYDLMKQSGTTLTKIIDGPAVSRIYTDSVIVNFRITRNKDGNWKIFSKTDKDTTFSMQGITIDKTYSASNFFGIYCKYTASRSNKFFFDNLSTYPLSADTIAPEIVHIDVENSRTITVQFDEALDTNNIYPLTNFVLDSNIHPISLKVLSEEVIQFFFAADFSLSLHPFKAINIRDLAGNQQDSIGAISAFRYIYHHLANYKDVIITEIFADPSPTIQLPPYEYIELYNQTIYPIALQGWTYTDKTSKFTFKNDSIYPKQYLILCKISDTADFQIYGKTIGISPWPSLNNSSDNLILKNNLSILIDSISYQISFYKDSKKRNGGYSLELKNKSSICGEFYNWEASNDSSGGTPAKENSNWQQPALPNFEILYTQQISDSSIQIGFNDIPDTTKIKQLNNYFFTNELYHPYKIIPNGPSFKIYDLYFKSHFIVNTSYKGVLSNISNCKGMPIQNPTIYFKPLNNDDSSLIVINEIFPDPSPTINLPNAEFIELYNPNDSSVDLTGWSLTDFSSTYYFNETHISAKEYLIICGREDSTSFMSYGKTKGVYPMISLNNSKDTLQLQNKQGRIINKAYYNDAWYQNTNKKAGGYSLEKIDPLSECDDAANWSASNSFDGGTPGKINSIYQYSTDSISIKYSNIQIIADSTLQITLNKGIRLNLFDMNQIYLADTMDNLIFPISYSIDSPYNKIITATFPEVIKNNYFKLFCNNLISCNGTDYYFIINLQPAPKYIIPALKFTEIMPDPIPSMGLPEYEYVEIINLADTIVHSKYLQISDKHSIGQLNDDSLFPGQRAIICFTNDSAYFSKYGKVIGIRNFPSLNNSSDSIFLIAKERYLIDSIIYFIEQWEPSKRDGGYSLERIENYWDCNSLTWLSSENPIGGSPGEENSIVNPEQYELPLINNIAIVNSNSINIAFNQTLLLEAEYLKTNIKIASTLLNIESVTITNNGLSIQITFNQNIPIGQKISMEISEIYNCLGQQLDTMVAVFISEKIYAEDVIINEILFNPSPNQVDFVELYNRSSKTIDLMNWQIGNIDLNGKPTALKRITQPYFLNPGAIVCLSIDSFSIQNQYQYDHRNKFIQLSTFPPFNDDYGTCILLNADSLQIDQFTYSEKMHLEILESVEGVSLERRNADVASNNPMNWTSAASDYGFATPTQINSQKHSNFPNNLGLYLEQKVFSPNSDGINDFLAINYSFEQVDLLINIKIYNRAGYLIDEPFGNATIGQRGVLFWDGIVDNNTLADGVYILLAQIYNTEGLLYSYKLPCALIH